MTRLLGAAPPRSFWLVLLLAVALLISVSTTLAQAGEARPIPPLGRDLGGLHVLSEGLHDAGPAIPATLLVHPPLFDGSAMDLANASLRRIKAMRRGLDALRPALEGDPDDDARRRTLTLELDRLHGQILTFRSGPGPDRAEPHDLDRSLRRMHAEWLALAASAPPRPTQRRPGHARPRVQSGLDQPTLPVVLRGTPL